MLSEIFGTSGTSRKTFCVFQLLAPVSCFAHGHGDHSPVLPTPLGPAHSRLLKGWLCENGVQHQMYHQPCVQTVVDNYPLGYFRPFAAFAQLKSNSFARSQNLDSDVKTTKTTTKQAKSMDLPRRKLTQLLKSTSLLGVPKSCPCRFQSKLRPRFFLASFTFSTTMGKDEEDTELDRQANISSKKLLQADAG